MDRIALVCVGILVVAWMVYPVIMGLMALVVRRRVPVSDDAPSVTVVIATRESPDLVKGRIDDILRTRYDRSKLNIVIAIDRRATTPIAEYAWNVDRVDAVIGDEPGGKAAALNAGVRSATGDIVVFTDVHQRFELETIPQLVGAFGARSIGAVTGYFDLGARSGRRGTLVTLYWSVERWLRRQEAIVHSSVGVTGAVYAMRRALWTDLRPNLILDDLYVPMQLVLRGYRIAFAREARAVETRSPSPQEEYHRKVRTLTGVIQLCRWFPALLIPIRNPIWAQFVCHKLLRLLTPYCVLMIFVWGLVSAVAMLDRSLLLVAAAGVAVAGAIAYTPWARQVRRAVIEGVLLQMAVVVAGINGLRGQWDVWRG